MRDYFIKEKCWLFLLAFFMVVLVSSCGTNSSVTLSDSGSQGSGTTPLPGKRLKILPPANPHYETMVVNNGIDYVGSDNGTLYALNGASGRLLWRYAEGAPVYVSAVLNGIVYSSADSASSAEIFALDASNGKVVWQYKVNDYVSSVILDGGMVYAATAATGNSPQLYVLRATNGSLLWHYTARSFTPGLLAVSNGVVYYAETTESGGSFDEYVRALWSSDGNISGNCTQRVQMAMPIAYQRWRTALSISALTLEPSMLCELATASCSGMLLALSRITPFLHPSHRSSRTALCT